MKLQHTSAFPLLLFLISSSILSSCAPSARVTGWEPCGSPDGATVVTVVAGPQNSRSFYCALRSGEFFASTDLGATWAMRGLIPSGSVRSFTRHPELPGYFYAATQTGLFRTSDGGALWTLVDLTASGNQPSVLTMAFDPWEPEIIIASTGTGLFRSTTGGRTWSEIPNSPPLIDLSVHPGRPGLIHGVRAEGGAMVSEDGGISWSPLTEGFDRSGTTITRMIAHPDDPEKLCIGTGGGDIYRSEDGGRTWDVTLQGTGFSPLYSFARSVRGPMFLFASNGQGVLRSTDFGASWRPADRNVPRLAASVVTAADSSRDLLIFYGPGAGILLSQDDGKSWQSIDGSLTGPLRFSFLRGTKDGRSIYAVSDGSVFRFAPDSGWTKRSSGLPGSPLHWVSVSALSDSLLYAATESGPYHSDNGGKVWNPLGKNMAGTPFSLIEAHPFIANRLFGMAPGGMMVSTDAGKSWNRTRPSMKDHDILTIMFHHADAGIVAVGTAHNKGLVSKDGGINWDEARYGIETSELVAISVSESGDSLVAWGSDSQRYLSVNKGIEWKDLDPAWTDVSQFRIAFDREKPWTGIALVNRRDLYSTENAGIDWKLLEVTSPDHPVNELYYSNQAQVLYGTGDGGGLIRTSLAAPPPKKKKK